MDLKTFVAESLLQIVQGVVESSVPIANLGGAVSPVYYPKDTERFLGNSKGGENYPVYAIDFDVALSATAGLSTEHTERLEVASVGVNTAIQQGSAEDKTISRIRFMVPLQLPVDPESRKAAEQASVESKAASNRLSNSRRAPNWKTV
ncbi:hypothetical protein [Variovorax guangxiensis]|uniref:hypothetical protein n=1 Tax=Variovorax guangxiensis TaxID=1775474 RepID=UPI0011260B8A|nr:hypothetical protein [Variovorax guangxiensis]